MTWGCLKNINKDVVEMAYQGKDGKRFLLKLTNFGFAEHGQTIEVLQSHPRWEQLKSRFEAFCKEFIDT